MKYKALKKREKELLLNGLKVKIYKIQDLNAEVDIEKLEALKKVMQDVIDSDDMESAMQMLAKYNLEGEKPTWFFCVMMKKQKKTAQFCSLI